jgi:indole-3-glycerol phosphate synthase
MVNIIAEIKKASPSAALRALQPGGACPAFETAGAAALPSHRAGVFQGRSRLANRAQIGHVPVLRKDFLRPTSLSARGRRRRFS